MTSDAPSLVRLLEGELKRQPKSVLVRNLVEKGSVEGLTELKVILVNEASECVPNFPKGEFYARRKPKVNSSLNSLEERLAEDIAELCISLDTHVVTPEIKAMFRPVQRPIIDLSEEQVNEGSETYNGSFNLTSSQRAEAMPDYTQVHQDCREQIAKMESAFLLFKESTRTDILKLEQKVNGQDKILQIQDKQISDLLNLTSALNKELKRIKQRSEIDLISINQRNDYSFTSQGRSNAVEVNCTTVEPTRNVPAIETEKSDSGSKQTDSVHIVSTPKNSSASSRARERQIGRAHV